MPYTVIVPLDRSPDSERALPLARRFVHDSDATVLLISVLSIPVEFSKWSVDHPGQRLETALEAELEDYLDSIATSFEGIPIEAVVEIGNPAQKIIETAERLDDALLIIAGHNRSGVQRYLLGSVTDRIMRHATCPVIVFPLERPSVEVAKSTSVNTILVPLDGSTFAERALHDSRQIFNIRRITYHFVRIIETMHWYGSGSSVLYSYDMDRYIEETRMIAKRYLDRVGSQFKREGYCVTWEVRVGDPVEQIHAVADERGADLIAMTTHGHTGFRRFFLGSVATRVLRQASVPVMLVRPEP